MPIGYARVRPDPRDAQSQRDALARFDVHQVFFDIGRTGANLSAGELDAAIIAAGEGGELAVTRLSRLARTLAELGHVLFRLAELDITLRVGPAVFNLRAADQLLVSVISVAAEFDADVAAQRATEGWRTARGTGQLPGRKPALTAAQEQEIVTLSEAGASAERLAGQFGVGRSTIYRIMARRQ